MAGTIDGIICDGVSGPTQALKNTVQVYRRPGLDGYGAMLLGAGSAPFAFRAFEYDTEPNLEAWHKLIEATQGTIITIVDDWDRAHLNLLVQSVSQLTKRPAIHENGGVRGGIVVRGVKTV